MDQQAPRYIVHLVSFPVLLSEGNKVWYSDDTSWNGGRLSFDFPYCHASWMCYFYLNKPYTYMYMISSTENPERSMLNHQSRSMWSHSQITSPGHIPRSHSKVRREKSTLEWTLNRPKGIINNSFECKNCQWERLFAIVKLLKIVNYGLEADSFWSSRSKVANCLLVLRHTHRTHPQDTPTGHTHRTH